MSSYTTFTLNELLERKGDAFVRAAVFGFSCKRNAEVDAFLQKGAVVSSRLKSSVTYLVFENGTGLCVGYFTLAIKPLSLPAALFSATERKRLERFSRLDVSGEVYNVAAYLIAQIGRNRNEEQEATISGRALMELAKSEIRVAQGRVGGQVVFLEKEQGNAFLEKFYASCGFRTFGSREAQEDGVTYDQMFSFLK